MTNTAKNVGQGHGQDSTDVYVRRNIAYYERHYVKGYKVVRLTSRRILRSYAYPALFQTSVYAIGQWTERRPGCGPLAVFEVVEAVKRFLARSCSNGHVVASCYFEPSSDLKFWSKARNGNLLTASFAPPARTVFADRVILTELLAPAEHPEIYPSSYGREKWMQYYRGCPMSWTQVRTHRKGAQMGATPEETP